MKIKKIILGMCFISIPVILQADVPLISIITYFPTDASCIKEFLEAVTAQTIFKKCELIIIDTADEQSRVPIINAFAERYPNIRYRNIQWDPGLYAGINMGIWLAKAPYVTTFLMGDHYSKTLLEEELYFLCAHQPCELVYSDYQRSETDPQDILSYQALWRTSIHDRTGYFMNGYSELYLHEFITRLRQRGIAIKMLPKKMVIHRSPSDDLIQKEWRAFHEYEKLISAECTVNEKPIVIVIPSYNNEQWYERNLGSVFRQKYSNYRVIYLDDVSTDNTAALVKKYIQACKQEHRCIFIQNKERVGALANIYCAIQSCYPEEIVIMVDGDDWLAHDHVLDVVNRVYQDPSVWITYGQFMMWPSGNPGWCQQIPVEWLNEKRSRVERWSASHLRTCYAALFHHIKVEDLMFEGKFWQMGWDLAIMFPMVEMAGAAHSRFIPEILYMYNRGTQLHDDVINSQLQIRLGTLIREKQCYDFLSELQGVS